MSAIAQPLTWRPAGMFLLIGAVTLLAAATYATTSFPLGAVVVFDFCFLLLYRNRWKAQGGDFLQPDLVYLFLFAVYIVLPLTLQVLFRVGSLDLGIDLRMIVACWLALAGVALGITSGVARRIAGTLPAFDGEWDRRRAGLVGAGLLAFGALLLFVLVIRVGTATYLDSVYGETYAAESGFGALAIGTVYVQIGLLVLFLARAESGKFPRVVFFVFALFSLMALRIGRRRMVVEIAGGLLAMRHYLLRKFKLKVMVLLAIPALVLMVAIGQARALLDQGLDAMVEYVRYDLTVDQFVLVLSEPETVPFSMVETMRMVPSSHSYRYGGTVVDAFQIMVPSFLVSERPLGPSQWFVWEYAPEIARAGGGFSYSLFAEGYLNFGLVGIFAVGAAVGLLFRTASEYVRQNSESKSRILLIVVLISYCISFMRGDFANLLKVVFVAAMLPTVAVAAYLGTSKGSDRVIAAT